MTPRSRAAIPPTVRVWLGASAPRRLVGVQRFEDMIHAKFEELVLLGFLKPRWQPPRS
jgi:hypothetical protein